MLLPPVFSLIYWGLTTQWLRARFRPRPPEPAATLEAAVFFRPVKRGVPELEEKAARLLAAARPGDQVLFGIDCEADAARCRAACQQAPAGVRWEIIPCPAPSASSPNPKITKLVAMAAHAAPELAAWLLTDSEALLERAFMDRFRAEWAAVGGCLTAGYRFTGESNLAQRFDHLSTLLTFWPGLAAAEQGGTLGFTLGACTVLRRAELESVGGWSAFAAYLAEDHRLGAALAAKGIAVRLSREVLVLDSDPLFWPGYLRHQHRMALTYRVCNPWGTLGMGLTHGFTFALAAAALYPGWAIAWLMVAATLAVRTATLWRNARVLGTRLRARAPRLLAAVAFASLAESAFWLCGWLPLPVRWGARRYRVAQGGALQELPAEEPSPKTSACAG